LSDSPPLLELSDVGVTFRAKGGSGRKKLDALRHLSLDIGSKELVVVVGESGSGKTTLGRVIAGLQRPTNGTMKFRGKDLAKADREDFLRYRRAVQMVHQDPYTSLNPALTIEQTLTAGLKRWNKGMTREGASLRAADLLSLVGLSGKNHLQKYPHQLSGGQRQRVAIARAISINPELIVLDEPVSMIDASLRIDILDMLLEIKQKLGTTYFFITHDVALAKYFSEKAGHGRMVVLYQGSVMELGDTEALVSAPANPYMMALIASTPGSRTESVAWSTKLASSQEDEVAGCRFFPRCIYAEQICHSTEPPLISVGPDHLSACHFSGKLSLRPSQPAISPAS
jgi:peptide/nickel transport system ATP-binding protein